MILNDTLILFIISLLSLDNTHILQGNFSKPIIGCSIIGALMGDFRIGLLIGITFQVLWLAILPFGGSFFPEGGISAMYMVFLLEEMMRLGYSLNAVYFSATLVTIFFALAGGIFAIFFRKLNARIIMRDEEKQIHHPVWIYILLGIVSHFILWFGIMYVLKNPTLYLIGLMSRVDYFILPVNWVVSGLITLGIILFLQKKPIKTHKFEIILSVIAGGLLVWFL